MPSIKCTNCGAVLKTQAEIPVGKKVKCPKCNEAFVVQAAEEPAPEPPKKKPAPPPEPEEDNPFAAMGGEEEEAPKPKKKSKVVADEEEGEGIAEGDAPVKKSRKGDDEEDEGDEVADETPKKKKKSNMVLWIVLGAVAFVLTCCICLPGGAYFIWIAPLVEKAKNNPEFKKAMEEINKKK